MIHGLDEKLIKACSMFDYIPPINETFDHVFEKKKQDGTWRIGLIVGGSGSGKSRLLDKYYNITQKFNWSNKPILSHFDYNYTKLNYCGLSSVPTWCRKYSDLSTGEKHRADMAINLKNNAVIDEFTSTVDRYTAKSISKSISKYIRKEKLHSIIFSTCHYDIINWLDPDWVYDVSKGEYLARGYLQQFPKITVDITPCHYTEWEAFKKHHYLTGGINKSSRCWLAWWDNMKVGFVAAIIFPRRNLKNAWRESRIVILPEFQGMGIGKKLSNTVAGFFTYDGCRYFSKTAHPKMGYREYDDMWKPTSTNLKNRTSYKQIAARLKKGKKQFGGYSPEYYMKHLNRLCFSHEYIG